MGAYPIGTAVTLAAQFLLPAEIPADPTTVTFRVRWPDDSLHEYVYGVAPEVVRVGVGAYECRLTPTSLPVAGSYYYDAVGTGDVEAVLAGDFVVTASSVIVPPTEIEIARQGPCTSWIGGDDVAAFDPSLGVGSDVWRLDDAAWQASQLLYELSGRQFPGVCERTVRPCRTDCGCFGGTSGLGPWLWGLSTLGALNGWGGWGWWREDGGSCGCGVESVVRLGGYPVREVLEVKIGGEVVDPDGYRLDGRRDLVRLADLSTTPPTDRLWPACQDLTLPDTEPGTYSVRYTWGADVGSLGRGAACQLAAELWKAYPANQGECRLPSRVTRIARSGITMERILPTADLLRQGQTGLQLVDSFIAQVNPTKARRRSAVFSPDVQRFARKVGQ